MRPISQVEKQFGLRWHDGQMSAEKKQLCAHYAVVEGKVVIVATVGCKEDLCQLDVSESDTGDVSIKAGGCADSRYTLKDTAIVNGYSCHSMYADKGTPKSLLKNCFCKVCANKAPHIKGRPESASMQGSECNAKEPSSYSMTVISQHWCTYVRLMSEDSDKYARTTDSGCSEKDQIEVLAGVHVVPATGGPLKRQEDDAILCVYLPGRKLQCWCSGIGCDNKFAAPTVYADQKCFNISAKLSCLPGRPPGRRDLQPALERGRDEQ
jgi:hypothetical protein